MLMERMVWFVYTRMAVPGLMGVAELTVVVEGFAVVEWPVRPNNLNISVKFKTLSRNNSHFFSIDFL